MITLHSLLFHWIVLSSLTGRAPSRHPPYASGLDLPSHALDLLPVGPRILGWLFLLTGFQVSSVTQGAVFSFSSWILTFSLSAGLPPSAHYHAVLFLGGGGAFTVLDSRAMLSINFMYNSLHLLIPNSQSLPPPPSFPLATTNLTCVPGSLFLFHGRVHLCCILDPHVSENIWYLSFSDLLHVVLQSLGSFMLLQMVLFHSFNGWVVFLCVCIHTHTHIYGDIYIWRDIYIYTHHIFFCPFINQWAFRLLPCLSYYK